MVGSSINLPVVPFETIRRLITDVLYDVKSYKLPHVCTRLGIQPAVGPDDEAEAHNSKRTYISRRILDLGEEALIDLARKVLREYPSEDLTEALAELTEHSQRRVSKLVRRDVLKVLNRLELPFGDFPVPDSLEEIFGAAALREGDSWCADRRSRSDVTQRACARIRPVLVIEDGRNRNYCKSRCFDVQGVRANTGSIGCA